MLAAFLWMLLALSAVLGAPPTAAHTQSRDALDFDVATQRHLRDDVIAALLTAPEEILLRSVRPSNDGLPAAHGLKVTSAATTAAPYTTTNVTAPVAAKALPTDVVAADQFPRALATHGIVTAKVTNVTTATKHCTIDMAAVDQLANDLPTSNVTTVEHVFLSKAAERVYMGTSVSAFVWCIAFAPEKVAAWTRRMEANPALAPSTLVHFITILVTSAGMGIVIKCTSVKGASMVVAALMAAAYSAQAPRVSIALVKIARALAWAATAMATCVGCVVALEGTSVAAVGRTGAAVLDGIAAAHE